MQNRNFEREFSASCKESDAEEIFVNEAGQKFARRKLPGDRSCAPLCDFAARSTTLSTCREVNCSRLPRRSAKIRRTRRRVKAMVGGMIGEIRSRCGAAHGAPAEAMATKDPRRSRKSQPKIREWPRHGIVRPRATARMFRLRARASPDAISASLQRDRNRGGEAESVGGESARACGKCPDWSHPRARVGPDRKEIRAIPRAPIPAADE